MNYQQRVTLQIILAAAVLLVPAFGYAQQAIETADMSCQPVITECGCGMIPNPKGQGCIQGTQQQNMHSCVCTETVNGTPTSGQCVATDKCLANSTGGKSVSQVTPQQVQAANGGEAASPSSDSGTSESSGSSGSASSGGTTQVASDQGLSAPAQTTASQDQSSASTQGESGTQNNPLTGGIEQNALGNYYSQTPQGETIQTGPPQDASQGTQVSAPTNVENALTAIGQPSDANSAGLNGQAEANFQTNSSLSQTVSSPMGNVSGLTDVGNENSLGNSTPGEIAQQDLSAIQSTIQNDANSLGSWVDSTLTPTDQSANTDGLPQSISEVRGTIYTPGAGGDNGGLYGSNNNYLNPSIPTVAAGFSSGYQYGQVLSVSNPATGQSMYAVVGDTCPACGTGIDMTPTLASGVGLTMQQGVGQMEVGVVADTGSYTSGAQLAASLNNPPDPWAGASATNLSSISSPGIPGVATVGDYAQYAMASDQVSGEVSSPENEISNEQQLAVQNTIGTETGGEGTLVPNQSEGNIEPSPTEPVTSAELPELASDQQISANAESAPLSGASSPVAQQTTSVESPTVESDSVGEQLVPNPSSAESPSAQSNTTQPITQNSPSAEAGSIEENSGAEPLVPNPTSAESPPSSAAPSTPNIQDGTAESQTAASEPNQNPEPLADLTPQERLDDVIGLNSPELGSENIDNPYAVSSGLTSGQVDANSYSPSLQSGQLQTWGDQALNTLQTTESTIGSWENNLASYAASFQESSIASDAGVQNTDSNSEIESEQAEAGPSQAVPQTEALQPQTQSAGQAQSGDAVPLPPTKPTSADGPTYGGVSIVDYLNSTGQDFSYAARQALAAASGISNYIGSAAQNLQLLKTIRGF